MITSRLIRDFTPSPVRAFLTRLGKFYAPEKKAAFPSQNGAFTTLQQLGWRPKKCIDVGAYHGRWAQAFLNRVPEVSVLMIEGQKSKEERLKEMVASSPNHLAYEMALLGASDDVEVNFVQMETGSSVFEESSYFARTRTKEKLTRLDTLLNRHGDFKDADTLKLDTQGYELEIMKGAENLLESVQVVMLEVSLVAVNKGAPLIAEVMAFMTSHHFRLFDICSLIRRKDGVLWQVDLLFIRDGVLPNLSAELTTENWGNPKFRAAGAKLPKK